MTKRTASNNDDDDGDGNKNGRKVIGLEHHAFLYIFLPSLHDYELTFY